MKKSCLFKFVVPLSIALYVVGGQQALAQEAKDHWQLKVMPGTHQSGARAEVRFDQLYLLSEGFAVLPPQDTSHLDQWPCFPNPADPNYTDCSSIAAGGVVTGVPAYTWSLSACNADTSASTNCGQIYWFYEDDTGDTIDHLITTVTVKQGSNYILATGNIDHGPNPATSGSIVVITDDVAFGTLGETGKNNGYCAASGKTCSTPLQGLASVTVTTKVGPSKIMKSFNIYLQ